MKFTVIIVLFALSFFYSPKKCNAQVLDTIEYSLKQKPKFFLNLNTFNSVVSNEMVNFLGFKTGLNYNKRLKFGVGYYVMTSKKVVSPISVTNDSLQYTTNGELRLNFISLSAEYIYYISYPWQFSFTPLQFSLGKGHYNYITEPDKIHTKTKGQSIILYEPNITGQYSVFKWFGVAVSVGYRVKVYSSKELKEDLSAPTFAIGIRVFVDELYKKPSQKK